jgi:hypothetical protein
MDRGRGSTCKRTVNSLKRLSGSCLILADMPAVPAPAATTAESVLQQIRETIESRLVELEPVAMELERLRRLREVLATLEESGTDTVTPDLSALLHHASAGGDAVG